MRILVSFLLLVLLPQLSSAQLNLQMDLESRIQDRVKELLTPLDSNVQVVASIKVRKMTAPLPGSGLTLQDYVSATEVSGLLSSEIKEVQITIYSSLGEIPNETREGIKQFFENSHLKAQIFYKSLASLYPEKTKGNEKTDATISPVKSEPLSPYAAYVFGAVCLVVAIFALKIILQGQVDRFAASMKSSGGSAQQLPESAAFEPMIKSGIVPSGHSNEIIVFQKMSLASLTCLLSDCYWCDETGYAQWIWQNLWPDQKTEIVAQLPWIDNFISGLTSDPEVKSTHLHPYYLKPFPIEKISNEDLVDWVNEHPSAWHSLSPMRQAYLPIPILEKVKLASTLIGRREHVVPVISSELKASRPLVSFASMSFEDELAIYESPQSIPHHLRVNVKSLVWLALQTVTFQKDVLQRYSAQQLAQIWIGPDKILEILEAQMDPKKLLLLRDYRGMHRPSRNSLVMELINQAALNEMSENTNDESGNSDELNGRPRRVA